MEETGVHENNNAITNDAFLEGLISLPKSNKKDIVADLYKIHLNEQVSELNNEFCNYYYASNIEDDTEYFAIVFNNEHLHPVQDISLLHQKPPIGLNKILAYSVVELSTTGAEHLVVIINSYDPKKNLQNYILEKGVLNSEQAEALIKSLTEMLAELSGLGIYQCNINPQNIIMDKDELLFLREFVHSMPNLYQPNQYLPAELLECEKLSREYYSIKGEVYALGITILEAYLGKSLWNDFNSEKEYNETRLENGSFKYLLNRAKISERFRIFFRFTLQDNTELRWKIVNLLDWVNGKHHRYESYDSISDVTNILSFEDKNYSNLKSLSYAFFYEWDKALRFTKDDKLYKWASREQIAPEVIQGIRDLVDLKSANVVVANNLNAHFKLTKLLSSIDPYGAIKLADFAISARSIPRYLHFLMVRHKKNDYEKVVKIMKDCLWDHYTNPESVGYLEPRQRINFKNNATGINFTTITKSIEKLVYALNPYSRCLSKMLDKYYVANLADMISALENIANSSPNKFTLDRNIVAFIAAKLDLKDEIKAVVLYNFPKLSEHPVILTLSVLNLLHQSDPEVKMPNICNAIGNELIKLMEEHLHNIEFKKKIITSIEEAKKVGDISAIVKVLSNQQQFINDYNGYYEACKQVKNLEDRIKSLKDSRTIFNTAIIMGQKFTVLASYILCLIVTVTVMF